jgi:hypothetical protein
VTTKTEDEVLKEKMRKRAFIDEKLNGGDFVAVESKRGK